MCRDEERNSASYSDKASKISFLEKIILFVSDETNISVQVRPQKIVAGVAAENTRHLIQLFIVASIRSREKRQTRAELQTDDLPEVNHDEVLTSPTATTFEMVANKNNDHANLFNSNNISTTDLSDREDSQSIIKEDQKDAVLDVKNKFSSLSVDQSLTLCNTEVGQTQAWLGQIISRPKCTEKLLRRPPFRFLHDIIMAVMGETGFGMNIYT